MEVFVVALYGLITLVFLVPFGICIFYCGLAVRQWTIGEKENNPSKKMGAIKAFSIAFIAMLFVMALWGYVMTSWEFAPKG